MKYTIAMADYLRFGILDEPIMSILVQFMHCDYRPHAEKLSNPVILPNNPTIIRRNYMRKFSKIRVHVTGKMCSRSGYVYIPGSSGYVYNLRFTRGMCTEHKIN